METLDIRDVWNSSRVRISDDRWSRIEHPSNRDGEEPIPTLLLVRQGSYRRRTRGTQVVGTPHHVTFYNPGEAYTVDHMRGAETRATVIRLQPEYLEDLLSGFTRGDLARPAFPGALTHSLCSSEAYRLHRHLLSYLQTEDNPDELFVEESLLDLLQGILNGALGEKARSRDARDSHSANRARIYAAQEYMSTHLGERITMGVLGAAVGCSPWHLSRQFSGHCGISVHRFLVGLRLRCALERILDGEEDLARLADELGFCSHSHFTAAFRREFGATPSALRRELPAEALRCLRQRISA